MDPFLLTHRVKGNLFDISSRLSPVSIRDQMIRGYSVVSRAVARGMIGPDKPLLVVGAGAAGATAAMVAADWGVPTTLLERQVRAFTVQLGARHRSLDPTIYDWPSDYSEKGEFPSAGTALPLRWEPGISLTIAGMWESKLLDEMGNNPNLKVVFGSKIDKPEKFTTGYRTTKKPIRVYFITVDKPSRRTGPHEFAMAISCIGPGSDRVEVGPFRGHNFWKEDPFSDEGLGLPDHLSPRIYISGGGDGALQDFLRIVANRPVRELYEMLPGDFKRAAKAAIPSYEDQYQRSFTWADPQENDHNIQKSLHESYIQTVTQALTSHEKKLTEVLKPVLRESLDKLIITLAFGCCHFSHCYPLNHFLALLLALYMEKTSGRKVLRPHTQTARIEGLNKHTCKQDPYQCLGESHEVYFVSSDCISSQDIDNSEDNSEELVADGPYNIIIVRHGIEWIKPLFGPSPNNTGRHTLPYYLGW